MVKQFFSLSVVASKHSNDTRVINTRITEAFDTNAIEFWFSVIIQPTLLK